MTADCSDRRPPAGLFRLFLLRGVKRSRPVLQNAPFAIVRLAAVPSSCTCEPTEEGRGRAGRGIGGLQNVRNAEKRNENVLMGGKQAKQKILSEISEYCSQ